MKSKKFFKRLFAAILIIFSFAAGITGILVSAQIFLSNNPIFPYVSIWFDYLGFFVGLIVSIFICRLMFKSGQRNLK